MEDIVRPMTSTALAALILGISLWTPAIAQDQVRVFDEAPSLEELRAILIPDSGPGQARKIEIPRRDLMTAPATTTKASALSATSASTFSAWRPFGKLLIL